MLSEEDLIEQLLEEVIDSEIEIDEGKIEKANHVIPSPFHRAKNEVTLIAKDVVAPEVLRGLLTQAHSTKVVSGNISYCNLFLIVVTPIL